MVYGHVTGGTDKAVYRPVAGQRERPAGRIRAPGPAAAAGYGPGLLVGARGPRPKSTGPGGPRSVQARPAWGSGPARTCSDFWIWARKDTMLLDTHA